MESWRLQTKWLISKSRQKELGDKRVLAVNCLMGKKLGDEGPLGTTISDFHDKQQLLKISGNILTPLPQGQN